MQLLPLITFKSMGSDKMVLSLLGTLYQLGTPHGFGLSSALRPKELQIQSYILSRSHIRFNQRKIRSTLIVGQSEIICKRLRKILIVSKYQKRLEYQGLEVRYPTCLK